MVRLDRNKQVESGQSLGNLRHVWLVRDAEQEPQPALSHKGVL